jgi:hypothetical protein
MSGVLVARLEGRIVAACRLNGRNPDDLTIGELMGEPGVTASVLLSDLLATTPKDTPSDG